MAGVKDAGAQAVRNPPYDATEPATPASVVKICITGHVIAHGDYFYTINPEGGYGRSEVLCCEECIRKPENDVLRQRMIEAGATELDASAPKKIGRPRLNRSAEEKKALRREYLRKYRARLKEKI